MLSPGSRVGAYEIVEQFGAGGMGEVYRARDTRLNRDVALKVLPPLFADDPERLARFEREARVLASLNHPHIAHIHGLEESGATLALAGAVSVESSRSCCLLDAGPFAERLPSYSGPDVHGPQIATVAARSNFSGPTGICTGLR
jgi:Protein kinase domain